MELLRGSRGLVGVQNVRRQHLHGRRHQAGLVLQHGDLQQHSVPVLARHSLRDLWMPRSRGLPPPACNAGTSRRFAALLRERGLDRVVVPDHRCRSAWDRCQRPVSAQPWHQRRVPCPTHDSEAQIASTRASGLQMPWLPYLPPAAQTRDLDAALQWIPTSTCPHQPLLADAIR